MSKSTDLPKSWEEISIALLLHREEVRRDGRAGFRRELARGIEAGIMLESMTYYIIRMMGILLYIGEIYAALLKVLLECVYLCSGRVLIWKHCVFCVYCS